MLKSQHCSSQAKTELIQETKQNWLRKEKNEMENTQKNRISKFVQAETEKDKRIAKAKSLIKHSTEYNQQSCSVQLAIQYKENRTEKPRGTQEQNCPDSAHTVKQNKTRERGID